MKTREALEERYHDLLLQCDRQLEQVAQELPPPRVRISDELHHRGVTRRQFLQWSSGVTAGLLLPPVLTKRVARAAELVNRLPVIWLHLAECTGCSESVLLSDDPGIERMLLDTLSLEYHGTLMAASGDRAAAMLHDAMETFRGRYVCVVEGAVPTGLNGSYLTLGPQGTPALEKTREVARHAAAVLCIGSCASFGNVQAAAPNPSDAKGVGEVLGMPVVNIPGCPANPANIIGTVTYFNLFGELPPVDHLSRPLWAYGKSNHEFCERRTHFEAGEFVDAWDDEGAQKRWCLFKMGCPGPSSCNHCG